MRLLRLAYQQSLRARTLCNSSGSTGGTASRAPLRTPTGLTCDELFDLSANRATRFVYMRTLPLKKQPELDGDVDSLVQAIEKGARTICERHLDRVIDDRAAVHLHTTALAIATHRTLYTRLSGASERVENVIRAAYGAQLIHDPQLSEEENVLNESDMRLRPDYWVIRAALWFSFDKMVAVKKMCVNMLADFGKTFETKSDDIQEDGMRRYVVSVSKCMYHDICRQEGLPQLTRVFCALDRQIYSPINAERHAIRFRLDHTLPDQHDQLDQSDEHNHGKAQSDQSSSSSSSPQCKFVFERLE